MIYCMVGNSSTEEDGYLVVSCNEETILSEKTLLEKLLETISNYCGKDYKIVEFKSEKEYIFVTNLPYEIYQKAIGDYKRELEQQFNSKA